MYYKEHKMAYHLKPIPKGQPGEASKIIEETLEFEDAITQNNPIMALVELSDLYGAITLYLEKHHPTFTMHDLATMAKATRRAFESGARK